jgi:hypothetical protein
MVVSFQSGMREYTPHEYRDWETFRDSRCIRPPQHAIPSRARRNSRPHFFCLPAAALKRAYQQRSRGDGNGFRVEERLRAVTQYRFERQNIPAAHETDEDHFGSPKLDPLLGDGFLSKMV